MHPGGIRRDGSHVGIPTKEAQQSHINHINDRQDALGTSHRSGHQKSFEIQLEIHAKSTFKSRKSVYCDRPDILGPCLLEDFGLPFFQSGAAQLSPVGVVPHAAGEGGRCCEFFAPLREWKFYVFAVFAVCYGTASSTATTFMPQIIGRFNLGKASDRLRQRSLFLVAAMTLTTIGCIILVALPITDIGPGYFACFLITMGAFVPTALFHSWHNNNDPSENGRAFRTGFLTFAANAGGLVSANIFLNSDAPKYTHALIISACLQVTGISIALGMRTYMALDNRRRNREQGVNWTTKDVPTADLAAGPQNPSSRHFL
ncbi:hypothetical protein DFH09DRAFT_1084629 [Mycena vulgaris]|nr:hypothetical protein DFH09DRAFT_1084629 [Mycena vulgaris]